MPRAVASSYNPGDIFALELNMVRLTNAKKLSEGGRLLTMQRKNEGGRLLTIDTDRSKKTKAY